MAGDKISVSHGDIEAQAKNLGNIKNQLEEILHTAKTQVDSLRESGGFDSVSGQTFNDKYAEWTQANVQSVSLLGDMGEYLNKVSGAFAEVDAAYTIK